MVYNETSRLAAGEGTVLNVVSQIRIEQPAELVFEYVADPEHFPDWNAAVRSVRSTCGSRREVGATYAMVRQLPAGPAENVVEIVARAAPGTFAVRTASGPTRFVHHYRFVADPGANSTMIRLDAQVDLGAFVALSGSLAHRVALGGVENSLKALKRVLEPG